MPGPRADPVDLAGFCRKSLFFLDLGTSLDISIDSANWTGLHLGSRRKPMVRFRKLLSLNLWRGLIGGLPMKKVISVLVLMLGASLSAFATSSCYSNLLVNVSDSCVASVDGTNFTVSLISLSNTSLNPAVNVNVNAYSSTSGTDTFTVQVYGANGTHFTSNLGANFDLAVSGNAGASVSSIQTTISGRGSGAVLTTSATPGGGPWSLSSALFSNATTSPTSVSPHFVSAEIDTGLTIPSGLSLSGYTETFTVIWSAYVPPPPPPPVIPPPPVPDPATGVPEPGSFGLAALAGLTGGLVVRRRRLQA